MVAPLPHTLTRSQRGFVAFCVGGFLISLLAWIVNLDVACRYFFGAGILPQALPGYRFLALFAVDVTTISTALPVAMFWLPFRAYRRLRTSPRTLPYPSNFFAICTYAGLTGTLVGVMIAFWQGGENLSPLDQAKSLFNQITVGLPTAIISTLTGILVPAAAHYVTKWYSAAFMVGQEQPSPLAVFFQTLQRVTAAFSPLVTAIGVLKQACVQSATSIVTLVTRTNEFNKTLDGVTKNLDAIGKKSTKAMVFIDSVVASNNRVAEAIEQSTAATGKLAAVMQLVVGQLSTLDASINSLRTETSVHAANFKQHIETLPANLQKAITDSVVPLQGTLETNRNLLANVGRALLSESPPSPPLAQVNSDAKRNGHAAARR